MNEEQLKALRNWLETQTLCWQSLAAGEESSPSDWQELLNTCYEMGEQQLPPHHAELAEVMAHQARGFCRYGERLLQAMQQTQDAPELEEAIYEFSSHLQDQTSAALLKQWQLPEHLSQFFTSLGIKLPSLPGFPFLQDGLKASQSHFKERIQAAETGLRNFRDALNEHIEIQQTINQATIQRLLEHLKSGQQPASLTELHTLWVDRYEDSYREYLQSPEYQRIYGRLSNASLQLQKLNRESWEQEYRSLGLVPLKDYTQLLERHHRLRKTARKDAQRIVRLEQRLLEHLEQNTQQHQQLQQQLQQLQAQLAELQATRSKPE